MTGPLVELPAGVGHVAARVRWHVLSADLDVIGEVTPDADQRATVSVSTAANIARACRGFTLRANDARHLNPFLDRLQPVWELEDGSRWPLGVFCLSAPVQRIDSRHTFVDATLLDLGYLLDQATTASVGVSGNASISDAIVGIIEAAGVTRHRVGFSPVTVGGPLNWPVGTSRLRILRALCELAGFLPPYFDAAGTLVVREPDPPTPGQRLSYPLDATSRVVAGTVAQRDNIVDAPNVYVVVGLSPGMSEIVGRAEIDSRLPHSVENRGGLVVPNVWTMQGVRDSAQAQRIAEARAARDPFQLASVSFTAAPDPRHDVFDLVEFDGYVWREDAWSLVLDPTVGEHQHTLTRQAVEVPGG